MKTYRLGKLAKEIIYEENTLPSVSEYLPPLTEQELLYNFKITTKNQSDQSAPYVNIEETSIKSELIYYEPSAIETETLDPIDPPRVTDTINVYTGKVLIPPFSLSLIDPNDNLEESNELLKIKVIGLIKADRIPASIWDAKFMFLPMEFCIPKGMRVGDLLAPILKDLNGLGVRQVQIITPTPVQWNTLEQQASDTQKKNPEASHITWIRGRGIASHGLPWYKPSDFHKGSNGWENLGSAIALTEKLGQIEVEENGKKVKQGHAIGKDDVLYFELWREKTGLQADGGAGKFDWGEFGVDTMIDMIAEILADAAH